MIRKATKGVAGLQTSKYLKKIENDPKNSNTWLNFAVYLSHNKRDVDRAERYFRRAIAVDPDFPLAYSCYGLFLGMCY